MYLLNTTFTVTLEARGGWQTWLRTVWRPTLQAVAPEASESLWLIDSPIADGALSYASQWQCADVAQLQALRAEAGRLVEELRLTTGDAVLAFSTLLKQVAIE